jgi:amino acid transporter
LSLAIGSVFRFVFGRALPTDAERDQRIGPVAGVAVLGLDALASAAYGPEAALTILLPLGAAGPAHAAPVLALVAALLLVVQGSYRQTIVAYPDGGGSYTVASRNLGRWPGLLAGSALWIDYVLNVAVAISAGIGALASMFPSLLPHTLALCLGVLALLAIVNLRGVRDSGLVFIAPTYAFVLSLGAVVAVGCVRAATSHGAPHPVVAPPQLPAAATSVTLWLLVRAFSSGCTAMTGIEAVSNAVPMFREPRVRRARETLAAIVAILAVLLLGVALLCRAYGVGATEPGRTGYQSVLSQLTGAVIGRGVLYHVTMASVVGVLCLSANTSFAGFPRLCRVLAVDGFLPSEFGRRGARLVYSAGIVLLSIVAAALLVAFHGITDKLIPLFAVGAFLAFTMSQLGMVAHWRREAGGKQRHALVLNLVGACATGATLIVIVVSKFTEGAWITVLLIAGLMATFHGVRRHFDALSAETNATKALELTGLDPPIVVVPLKRLDRVALKGLCFALAISPDVQALQLLSEDPDEEDLTARWRDLVEEPARRAGRKPPDLVVLRSSRRRVVGPVLDHVQRLSRVHADRSLAVLVPELVERRWYHLLLHSHTATALKAALLMRGGPRVVIINTPWHAAAAT